MVKCNAAPTGSELQCASAQLVSRYRLYCLHALLVIKRYLKDKSKVGCDTISVKAHWERWCRWNSGLRVKNVWKNTFSVVSNWSLRHAENVHMCILHHTGEGVRSQQNGQLELRRWRREGQRDLHTAISVRTHLAELCWKTTRTSCQ